MDAGRMKVDRLDAPTAEPIDLPTAKKFLRVEEDFADDDDLIADLIAAARESCEARVDRCFLAGSYRLTLDGFPGPARDWALPDPYGPAWPWSGDRRHRDEAEILVPRPPLIAASKVEYLDPDGELVELDPARYRVVPGTPGVLAPALGRGWPAAADVPGAVAIEFAAGYGDDPSAVPACVRMAMRFIVAHMYEHRTTDVPIPETVDRILDPARWGGYA